jgi:hypothetical protein
MERFGFGHNRGLEMAAFLRARAENNSGLQTIEEKYLNRQAALGGHMRKRAAKLCRCAEWLHFRHYPTIDLVRLHGGRFCQQDKLCPNCARRRGAKALRAHVERVQLVLAESPQLGGYMGTWTLRNQSSLRSMFDHLWSSWNVLLQRRRDHLKDPRRNQYTELASVAGGVISAEVKRGEGSKLWHLHIHALLLAEREPDQQQLRREWHEITGDSHVVDVRPFHYLRNGEPATQDNLCRDAVEVFKYAVKLNEMTLEDNWAAHCELFGARMLRSFGSMWGVKVPESMLDEPLDEDDRIFFDWFYRFDAGTKCYQLDHCTP